MKKSCFVLVYIITCIILVGCWDYREIEEVEIVLGLGIDSHVIPSDEVDQLSQSQYRVTYEIVGIESEQGQLKSRVLQDDGNTLFRAIRKIIEKNGKQTYLAHIQILIISEELARSGIIEILDYTMRDGEYRPDVHILITDGCKAEQMFADDSVDVASMKLNDAFKNQKRIGTYESTTVWNVIDKLTQKGYEPAIPLIRLDKEHNEGKLKHTIGGTAVFKGSKMVGKLTEDETLYYLFVDDEITNQPLSMEYYFDEILGHISLEILYSKTKITPVVEDGKITMNIDINCNVALNELSNYLNILNEQDRQDVEKYAEKTIEEGIQELVTHVQKDYKSDIFGFGDVLKRKDNKAWKKVEENWEDIFPSISVATDVDVYIERSALSSKSIEVDKY